MLLMSIIDHDQVPVFIAEIAPKNLRGTLTAVTQVKIAHSEITYTLFS